MTNTEKLFTATCLKRASSFMDIMRNPDLRAAGLGGATVVAPSLLALTQYHRLTPTYKDPSLMRKLVSFGKSRGTRFESPDNINKQLGANVVEDSDPAFLPGYNTISFNPKYSPSTMAHEIGHSMSPRFLPYLGNSALPAIGTGAGSMLALLARNPRLSRNMAIGGALLSLPKLWAETDASMRGASLLHHFGATPTQQLKAFSGLPSYALMAGIPMLAHYGKQLAGGFEHL